MQKMKFYLLLLMTFFISACQSERPAQQRNVPQQIQAVPEVNARSAQPTDDSLVYVMNRLQHASKDCDNNTDCLGLTVMFPEFKNAPKALQDSMKYVLGKNVFRTYYDDPDHMFSKVDFMERDAKAYLKLSMEDFDRIMSQNKRSAPNNSGGEKWEIEKNVTVLVNTPQLLTLKYNEYANTGGAHPNHSTRYIHFNPKTGKVLQLADFFDEKGTRELARLAEAEFAKKYLSNGKISMDEAGFMFDKNMFHLNENFHFANEQITFVYVPYEIAAYAFGYVEITVPLQEVKPYQKFNIPTKIVKE